MSDHLSFLAAHVHDLRLADWCALLAVVVSQRIAALAGMWSYALFTLPGTVAHEAAHYVIAFLLGGRPSFPDLLPEREKYGWRIGGVRFSSGLLRNVPIALAPIGLLPLGLWWANGHLPHLRMGTEFALQAWASGTVIGASLPSSQDVRIAMPTLLLAAIAWFVVWKYA
jgi:hypothetical protein